MTNFIPNIGFVLGLVPAGRAGVRGRRSAAHARRDRGLRGRERRAAGALQPKFVGDAVDLSLTLSFFSVVFWTFVIGPLGAILSIPLTLLVRDLLLDRDPDARFLRWLSGD